MVDEWIIMVHYSLISSDSQDISSETHTQSWTNLDESGMALLLAQAHGQANGTANYWNLSLMTKFPCKRYGMLS